MVAVGILLLTGLVLAGALLCGRIDCCCYLIIILVGVIDHYVSVIYVICLAKAWHVADTRN